MRLLLGVLAKVGDFFAVVLLLQGRAKAGDYAIHSEAALGGWRQGRRFFRVRLFLQGRDMAGDYLR